MTDADVKTVKWHREQAERRDLLWAWCEHHIRAADAIEIIALENEQSARLLTKLQAADDRADALAEENARLRDMLDDTVGALEALCGERPAWQYLLDEVRTELRKSDAAGGDHE